MRILLSIITVFSLLAASQAFAQQAVRIGTSSVGSVLYTLAIGAGEVIGKHTNINATAEAVGGSAANVNGLAAKKIEFAIVNSFAAFSGYHGKYGFKKPIDLRLVMQGQATNRFLFVRKGAGIKTPRDLAGKTIIAKRRALPELDLVMDAFIKHFSLARGSMKLVATTNSGETLDAIRAGSVDAVLMPFSRRAGQIERPMKDGVMEFMGVSRADRDAMLKMLPANFFGVTLPANDFSGQPKPVHLFSLNIFLIARPDVSEEIVYQVAKALYDNNKEFVTYHRVAGQWTAQRALKNVSLPFHAGVIRYFKETGRWSAELEGQQKALLNR